MKVLKVKNFVSHVEYPFPFSQFLCLAMHHLQSCMVKLPSPPFTSPEVYIFKNDKFEVLFTGSNLKRISKN